jgi:hypothetical protein
VDHDDERVFFAGVVVGGLDEPSLHIEAIIFPGDGFGLAPCGFEVVVVVGDLFEVAQRTRPDLGRVCERAADERDLTIVCDRNAHHQLS